MILACVVSLYAIYYYFPEYLQSIPYINSISIFFEQYSIRLLTLLIGFVLFALVGKVIVYPIVNTSLNRFTDDEDDIHTFKKLTRFIWWTLFVIFAIGTLIGFSKFATSIGLIGLGLSLALQKPILNIVGWFVIVTKQLYREGDRIEIFAQRTREMIRGDVKQIDLFHTVLDGLHKDSESSSYKTVSFPNEFILFSETRNYSKESNYILIEVHINITTKSNYAKAQKILDEVLTSLVKRYANLYLKRMKSERLLLEDSLHNMLQSRATKKNKEQLLAKKKELNQEIKRVEDFGAELKPRVHIDILEVGCIRLIGQYLVPYTQVKKSRTEIFNNFLDRIAKEKDIDIFVDKRY